MKDTDPRYNEIQGVLDKLSAIDTAKHGCIIPPEEQYVFLKSLLKLIVDVQVYEKRLETLEKKIV